ncbi:MAG: hypothetical protein RLZZ69_2693, partial [Cyanobacteriota bacterium]
MGPYAKALAKSEEQQLMLSMPPQRLHSDSLMRVK